MKPIRYLVPVTYSRGCRNTLQYAITLAKASGGSIDILHLTRADEIAESDNPVVVIRSLNHLQKKATNHAQLLAALVTESGKNTLFVNLPDHTENTVSIADQYGHILYRTRPRTKVC